jgi:hypothetical protein
MTIWFMPSTGWKTKATDTHSEYVIHFPFLRQKWLRERASMLRDMHISCLVKH